MEEIPPEVEHVHAHALAGEDRAENSCRFKGIRLRKWGSWISEIRMPRSRQKLWLGSYTTAEQAARAYDAAVCCLRGPNARLNFPSSVPSIPSASSLSRHEIQLAAARHAATLGQLPAILASEHNNNENASANDNKAREDSPSLSRSASVQETMSLMNGQHQQEQEQEQETALWESLLAGSGDCVANNLERLPSIDESSGLNLIPIGSASDSPSWAEQRHGLVQPEEDMNNFLDVTLTGVSNIITSYFLGIRHRVIQYPISIQ